MPPRTRSTAPASRIYTSTPAKEQIKFRPRKKLVTYRHSTGSTALSRQETLTQMDFVNLPQPLIDDEEIEDLDFEIEEKKRKTKRRRTDGDMSRNSHYTQTLTQIDFVSTPASRLEMKNESYEELDVAKNSVKEEMEHQVMGPPRTPSRRRIFEVPSSQSPADSPFSVTGTRYADERSPLKEKSLNVISINNVELPPVSLPGSPVRKIIKLEIEDTFDSSEESQQTRIPSTPARKSSGVKSVRFSVAPRPQSSPSKPMRREVVDSEAESEDEESCYGELGTETQLELDKIVTSSSEMPTPVPYRHEVATYESTQSLPSQRAMPSQYMVSQFTQGQRLSTQQVIALAPRSPRSDVFISIHSGIMEKIVDQTRDHEFRTFRFPDDVSRLWFYEQHPVSRVKYMASISGPKQPGEIENLEGEGNLDFNSSKGNVCFAYEILQIYELADPLPLKTLKDNAWLEAPPLKYKFVRPAVLDALLANLRYPLFHDDASPLLSSQNIPSTPLLRSDSQDAEAQLHCTIRQFTQLPSSQTQSQIPRPSQATTVDLTQQSNADVDGVTEVNDVERDQSVIPESPSHLLAPISSPLLPPMNTKNATSGIRPQFSMSSSQLLTRSQLLPDSLLHDSIPPPPEFIEDSEAEDDEL